MKLVAVSVVKNEADIIEAFVRHTRAWTDLHLIFDHASTDGSREILAQLVAEGLPLRIYTDDALGNLQQFRSNHLTRLAVDEFGADWVLPLDADEIVVASDRTALEEVLGAPSTATPVTWPMANYYPTRRDPAGEPNPVRRLAHRTSLTGASRKVIVPAALARDRSVTAGKGSHALYRGESPLPDQAAPAGFQLAHFALRTLGQQVLRVVTAELQKLGRGRAHAGLDVHYRLGFQLLADHPDLFAETFYAQPAGLTHDPVQYLGGPLRYSDQGEEWKRVARALLPFLEHLARSHGELTDRLPAAEAADAAMPVIRPLAPAAPTATGRAAAGYFFGFEVIEGLQPLEGPFPGAFLPTFRWGTAPRTALEIRAAADRTASLRLECLAYLEGQILTVTLNGTELLRFQFPRVNQKERIELSLPLTAGSNRLELSYARSYESPVDPRRLSVIFLAIQVG